MPTLCSSLHAQTTFEIGVEVGDSGPILPFTLLLLDPPVVTADVADRPGAIVTVEAIAIQVESAILAVHGHSRGSALPLMFAVVVHPQSLCCRLHTMPDLFLVQVLTVGLCLQHMQDEVARGKHVFLLQ